MGTFSRRKGGPLSALYAAGMSGRPLAVAAAAATLGIAVLCGSQLASGRPAAAAACCPTLPKNNQWNLPVDKLPVASD